MSKIQVLDSITIDKIAAGEVVERPSSVVKELVENAIDAGATSLTIEIKDGGIELIRITDNGCGIDKEDVRNAFLRHATSKIRSESDLNEIATLGFRGEALASISAVSKVEMISKTKEQLCGVHYYMEGGKESGFDEVGVPTGTTIIVRNLFFNVPARRKFLKSPLTETGYIAHVIEKLALSRPEISIHFIVNGKTKLQTSGSGDLREVIYRIYGRDTSKELIPIHYSIEGITLEGYLGLPNQNRSSRAYETYFVNHRFIRSDILANAIEEGYREYLMQHRFPFCVIHLMVNPSDTDVNVHPAKMEVRFSNSAQLSEELSKAIQLSLAQKEDFPSLIETAKDSTKVPEHKSEAPQPFETNRLMQYQQQLRTSYLDKQEELLAEDFTQEVMRQHVLEALHSQPPQSISNHSANAIIKTRDQILVNDALQLNIFEERLLTPQMRSQFQVLAQIFDTYWLVLYQDERLFIVDQHAAHEKVKYETLLKQLDHREIISQELSPPLVVTLTSMEETVYKEHQDYFTQLGFAMDFFGGNELVIRQIPYELFGASPLEILHDLLDALAKEQQTIQPEMILHKLASMSCKAAVKGSTKMTKPEMESLLDALFELDNPYTCPHGRPTIIAMTKYEIEKKFKRVVT